MRASRHPSLVAVRVSIEVSDRLDVLAVRMTAASPVEVERSDAARLALAEGLAVLEARYPAKLTDGSES